MKDNNKKYESDQRNLLKDIFLGKTTGTVTQSEIFRKLSIDFKVMFQTPLGRLHFKTRYQQDDSLKKDRYFNKRRASLKMCSKTRKRSEEIILNLFINGMPVNNQKR